MVILYTTGCPQCKVLKAKLDSKNIKYTIVDDVDKMLDLGLMSAPNLGVNDTMFNFNEARKLVDAYEGKTAFEKFVLENM